MANGYNYIQDPTQNNYPVSPLNDPSWPGSQQPVLDSYNTEAPTSAPEAPVALLEQLQLQDPEPEAPQKPATPPPSKTKKNPKSVEIATPETRPEPSQPAPWQNTSKPTKSFLQIQKEEEAEKSRAQASPEVRRYADTVVKQPASSWGTPQRTPPVSNSSQATASSKEKPKSKPKINPNNPPPPSDKFLNWCKLMLRGLIEVKVDDVITMLLGFPLDPPPHFKEIVQEMFYEQRSKGNQQLVDSHKFAQEFIIRRKVDCGLLTADALPTPSLKPPQPSSSASNANDSFQVVSKKTRKRAN
ncbi:kinesin-like protein [Entomophthora muscae]|uniref:Kinesin-like protein n=1 Tax=Entomophthora muscae TaxID=34485 RepID=A0ACC2TLX2_9FUNG|nr:kinesin-like protein [Entomophthora muscae]